MATRNFYDIRSVAAFLLYSIRKGHATDSLAAAAELVGSGCRAVADHVATWALLLAPPLYGFLPAEQRLAAALSLPPFDLPTPLLPLSSAPFRPTVATVRKAVKDALKHGRIERAAALSLACPEASRASLLESVGRDVRWLSSSLSEDRVFLHAYTATTAVPPLPTPFPTPLQRAFALSSAALAEWNVPSPPLALCVGAPVWVLDSAASPFWKDLVARHGVSGSPPAMEGRTDDATEAFYAEGFPYDIPDEWSEKEREKSHGIVVTGTPSVYEGGFWNGL